MKGLSSRLQGSVILAPGVCHLGFRAWGVVFEVRGLGFRVQGIDQGLGFQPLALWVWVIKGLFWVLIESFGLLLRVLSY